MVSRLPELSSMKRTGQGMSPVYADLSFMWINLLQAQFSTNHMGGWPDQCDARGWINQPGVVSPFNGGATITYAIPDIVHYNGQYILVGEGDGDVNLIWRGTGVTWVVDTGASYGIDAVVGNGYYRVKEVAPNIGNSARSANPPWKIVLTRTSHGSPPVAYAGTSAVSFTNTNWQSNGRYIKNVALLRIGDHAAWVTGKHFRNAYKDMIIEQNPSYVRFQSWNGALEWSGEYRFRNRTLPDHFCAPWGENLNGVINYTNLATLTMAAESAIEMTVTGVAGQTPASMKHGEIAMFSSPNDWVTAGGATPELGSGAFIINVTKATQAVVTIHAARNWGVGDEMHIAGTFFDMCGLNLRIVPIVEVISSTQFKLDINTSAMNTWNASGTASGKMGPAAFLKVGTGGDRGGPDGRGYPILQLNGYTPVTCHASAAYPADKLLGGVFDGKPIAPTFYFDMNAIGQILPNGTVRHGAWLCTSQPSTRILRNATVPIEYQGQFINELEERIIETGQLTTKGPINPWICVPVHAMLSIDPTYDVEDNYAIGMVDVLINPSSTKRKAGYNVIPTRCKVFVEYANECFNTGGGQEYAGMPAAYTTYMGCMRWGDHSVMTTATAVPGDPSGWVAFAQLRAVNINNDINVAFPAQRAAGKIIHVVTTWAFGLSGPPGSYGYPVYGGGDYACFATAASPSWATKFVVNGSGNVPPGASSTFYPWGTDLPALHWDYITAGGYTIIFDPRFKAWYTETNWDNPVKAWRTGGLPKQMISATPNAVDNRHTDITINGTHTYTVGMDVVIPDVVQTGGSNTAWELIPCKVIAVPTSSKITINLDTVSGTGAGTLTGGTVMAMKLPAQDAACNVSMAYMTAPNDWEYGDSANYPENMTLIKKQHRQMADVAATYGMRFNSYEAYIQLNLSAYFLPGSMYDVSLTSAGSSYTPGSYPNIPIISHPSYGTVAPAVNPTANVIIGAGGSVTSVTMVTGGRYILPNGAYTFGGALAGGNVILQPLRTPNTHIRAGGMVLSEGLTPNELVAFLMNCYECSGLASYVDPFFGHPTEHPNIDGIANLTMLVSLGTQWGIQFMNPWNYHTPDTEDWSEPNLVQQALTTYNDQFPPGAPDPSPATTHKMLWNA